MLLAWEAGEGVFDRYDLKLVGDTHQTAGVTGGGESAFASKCGVSF